VPQLLAQQPPAAGAGAGAGAAGFAATSQQPGSSQQSGSQHSGAQQAGGQQGPQQSPVGALPPRVARKAQGRNVWKKLFMFVGPVRGAY
jgi:hypothetical protein